MLYTNFHFFGENGEGICKSIYEGVWTNPYNLGKTPLNSVCVGGGGGGGGGGGVN